MPAEIDEVYIAETFTLRIPANLIGTTSEKCAPDGVCCDPDETPGYLSSSYECAEGEFDEVEVCNPNYANDDYETVWEDEIATGDDAPADLAVYASWRLPGEVVGTGCDTISEDCECP